MPLSDDSPGIRSKREIRRLQILALCGSLRAASTNLSLLKAAQLLAPPSTVLRIYEGLEALPHFNPDREPALPPPVAHFRQLIAHSDAILISSPEYAHGVPGALKDALDWLVGGGEISGKPVTLLNASNRGHHAQAALIEILTTMGAIVVTGAIRSIPLVGQSPAPASLATDPAVAALIRSGLDALLAQTGQTQAGPSPVR